LSDALGDEDVEVRETVVHVLRQLDGCGAPALGKALKDENRYLRITAAEALVKLGPEAKGAVPALSEALRDELAYVRERAAQALKRIGPEARAAVPALTEALEDANVEVRRAAAAALKKIDPETAAASDPRQSGR